MKVKIDTATKISDFNDLNAGILPNIWEANKWAQDAGTQLRKWRLNGKAQIAIIFQENGSYLVKALEVVG